jgi:hypothetical protein
MWFPTDRNLYRLLTDWGGVIAGILALAAAWWTVRATRFTAKDQIVAAREQADKQIAASRVQADKQITAAREEADRMVAAARSQSDTMVDLETIRHQNQDRAFCVMLEAAMARVLAEAAWARRTYPQLWTQTTGASPDALIVRQQCITKGAFAELRAACVTHGSPLTGEFLDLEREIDSFAPQWEDHLSSASVMIRWGKHAGLGEQLASIEAKATALHDKAVKGTG